jgi:hypothetical protein
MVMSWERERLALWPLREMVVLKPFSVVSVVYRDVPVLPQFLMTWAAQGTRQVVPGRRPLQLSLKKAAATRPSARQADQGFNSEYHN